MYVALDELIYPRRWITVLQIRITLSVQPYNLSFEICLCSYALNSFSSFSGAAQRVFWQMSSRMNHEIHDSPFSIWLWHTSPKGSSSPTLNNYGDIFAKRQLSLRFPCKAHVISHILPTGYIWEGTATTTEQDIIVSATWDENKGKKISITVEAKWCGVAETGWV